MNKIAALFLATALAGGTASVAMAQAARAVTPRLAANVKPAPTGFEAANGAFLVANPTKIFSDQTETASTTGDLPTAGAPVPILAKVRDRDWYLIGRDGVGIGYVPRALMRPAA